jgi:hypothetical protein
VGVDDLVDEVFEPVGGLFPFPGAGEAVAQDPRAVSRAEPASVLDQFCVGGAEVLAPDVGHELRELPFIEAEAFRDRLMHVMLADPSQAAAAPDVGHALVELAGAQAEPGLPHPGHAEVPG